MPAVPIRVTVDPEVLQIAAVCDERITGLPDPPPVTEMMNGPSVVSLLLSVAKLMTCGISAIRTAAGTL